MQRTIGTGVRAPAFDPAMLPAPERLRDALRAHHGAEPPRPSRGAAADPSPARPFDGAQAIAQRDPPHAGGASRTGAHE